MSDLIRHEGIVLAVKGEKVSVQVIQSSACSACAAKAMCQSSESKTQIMEVVADELLYVGDKVEVLITPKMGWKAVLWAYIMPFLLLVGVVIGLRYWVDDEAVSGSIALGVVALYYLVLSCFRQRLERQFSIRVIKLN